MRQSYWKVLMVLATMGVVSVPSWAASKEGTAQSDISAKAGNHWGFDNNYYLARWTPLSNNFRVYCVKDGKPRRLANLNVKADRKAWHTIRVTHQGDRIKASLDDQKPIEVTDAAFTKAGMIGLCTKADARAAFDDFQVK